jgi:hypothetical protein
MQITTNSISYLKKRHQIKSRNLDKNLDKKSGN